MEATQVEARLRSLERRLTRTSAACVALASCLVACVAISARTPPQDVLRAKRIELVDRDGNVRVLLAAEFQTHGMSGIEIEGPDGRGSVTITAGLHPTSEGGTATMAIVNAEANDVAYEGGGISRLVATETEGSLQVVGEGTESDATEEVYLLASPSESSIALTRDSRAGDAGEDDELEPLPSIVLSDTTAAPRIRVQNADGKVLFQAP